MSVLRTTYHHIRTFPPVFWVVILATLMNQAGNMAFVFLVLYLTKHLGFSLARGAFSFVVLSASMMIMGLFGGSYVDRLGAARIMTSALFINGVVLLLFPYMHSYGTILIFCMLWGLSYGIYRPASQTFISLLSKTGLHKITFSVYRLAINLGMSIGPALGGFLAAHSFHAIFIVNGAANIMASVILIIGLNRNKLLKPLSEQAKRPHVNLGWLKQDHLLRMFLLGMIPITMVFFQHESTLPIFLNKHLELPLSFYGLLFTLNTLMIASFELPLNVATINWSYRTSFVVGTFFITAGFAALVFATASWEIILSTVIWTIGEMILYPSASSFIADIAPEDRRGSYMSLFSSCSNLGMMLGPWSGAIVMQHFGPQILWVVCGLWGALSMMVFATTPNIKQVDIEAETAETVEVPA